VPSATLISRAVPTATLRPALRLADLARRVATRLDGLAPIADLAVRLFVANIFFQSGLSKLASWSSTVSLFENEYAVPLLPPEAAAFLGTGIELFFPVLLALGLGSRFAAFALFLFNIVAVISYPDLGTAGLTQHVTWGLLLLVALLHGPGPLSLDRLLDRLLGRREFGAAR
jgi:putative oxidoreductase